MEKTNLLQVMVKLNKWKYLVSAEKLHIIAVLGFSTAMHLAKLLKNFS